MIINCLVEFALTLLPVKSTQLLEGTFCHLTAGSWSIGTNWKKVDKRGLPEISISNTNPNNKCQFSIPITKHFPLNAILIHIPQICVDESLLASEAHSGVHHQLCLTFYRKHWECRVWVVWLVNETIVSPFLNKVCLCFNLDRLSFNMNSPWGITFYITVIQMLLFRATSSIS